MMKKILLKQVKPIFSLVTLYTGEANGSGSCTNSSGSCHNASGSCTNSDTECVTPPGGGGTTANTGAGSCIYRIGDDLY